MMTPIKQSTAVLKRAVYKRREFSDLLTSNNFYTASAIAIVLGFASAFGFIDNPRKLKSVVDTLSYKVSMSHVDNQTMPYQVFQQEKYDLSASLKNKQITNKKNHYSEMGRFDEEKKYLYGDVSSPQLQQPKLNRVAFSYDITSNKFWNDLNASNIGSINDDLQKDHYHSHKLSRTEEGAHLLEKEDFKYSIATELRRD